MFKIKPLKCRLCGNPNLVKASCTVQAPVDDFYWYCRECNNEIADSGWPVYVPGTEIALMGDEEKEMKAKYYYNGDGGSGPSSHMYDNLPQYDYDDSAD